MRLQLALAAGIVAGITFGGAPEARAAGTIAGRGGYYKERAHRVMQPMMDGLLDAGARGLVTGQVRVDEITTA